MTLSEDKHNLTPGRRVELFDFTSTDRFTFHWIAGNAETQPVRWRGADYAPLPIEASGFDVTGQGRFPRPKLKISNILLVPGAIINEFGDPLGAQVTRWVTFAHYLDGAPGADPAQHFLPQVFRVERKVSHNRVFIEFELASLIDQEGAMLPGRQVLRDTCTHVYRVYDPDTDTFDYTQATCPYAGTVYFRRDGVRTSVASQDACDKTLRSGCKLRFGTDALPFRGYPAVAKLR